MSATVSSLSAGAACEPAKLIVQVVGKDHPQSQRLVIYDESGQEQQEWLTQQDKPEYQQSATFSSVLHVWDWEGQPNRHLWLEIAASEGGPIRLPLLDDMRPTPRQDEHQHQWNQIVPVVPMTALPGSKSFYDLGTPVSLRSGFIYVFYRNALWRELEVRIEGDKTTYHDVNVERYRQGSAFRKGARKATGQALADIWLPSQWNNSRCTDLQLGFSEVQLSAARLKRLEQDKDTRQARCKSPDLRVSQRDFKRMYEGQPNGQDILDAFAAFDVRDYANQSAVGKARIVRLNLGDHAFPISLPAPQRIREPGYEWLLNHPGRYICDLTGQFPVQSKQTAQSYLDSCEQKAPQQETRLLELEAWRTCLTDLVKRSQPARSDATEDEPGPSLWEAQPAVADVLSAARNRQLCGVLLDDPMHRMRHLAARITDLQQTLPLCAQRAAQHANHGSAVLLQQLVVPRTLQGQRNPLHEALEKINEQGKRDINCYTATPERMMLWRELSYIQDNLSDYLGQSEFQQALADHLSLDEFDYLAAFFASSQMLTALAASPAQIDPLAVNTDLTDALTGISSYSPTASKAQAFLSELAKNSQHPLHAMLWPNLDMDTLYAPYQAPAQRQENQGDGHYRATELAQFERQGVPASKPEDTLDTNALIGLMASGSLNSTLTAQLKAGASALVSIYEGLQGAINTAQGAVDSAHVEARSAQQGAQAAARNHAQANEAYAQQRAALASRGRQASVRLHAQGLELMRSTLPQTFGGAMFIRRGNVNTRDYYVFGLEDLPEISSARAVRMYGQFQDAEGNLLATTNGRQAVRSGLTQTSDHMLVAIARTDATARMISTLNQQINQANQAAVQAQTTQVRATRATGALQQAVDEVDARGGSRSYRVLNSTPFATGVLMLELWNVRAELNAFQATRAEKSGVRAVVGVAGALIDLAIAMETLTVKFVSNKSILASARKELFQISSGSAVKVLGPKLGEQLVKSFTSRLIGQTFAGLIFLGINLYDAWYAFQWGDDAMWGYLLMAGGASTGVVAGLLSASPVLGLTPLGWAALVLLVAGAGAVYWLSSTPIEDWMTNGPFSDSESAATAYLRVPQQAFYRLLGLFAGIRIQVTQNPDYDATAKLDVNAELPYQIRSANTLARIDSNLPGLIGKLGSLNLKAECRMRTTTSNSSHGGTVASALIGPRVEPLAQRSWPNALELYFNTPAAQHSTGAGYFNRVSHSLAVKAQFGLTDPNGKTWYFPAPTPKTVVLTSEANRQPDFSNDEQPFWASE
ncbi:toxin VasX [Pseudomonas sp. EL_65y_Pfl2_R95]|uniref:toxin VasX n=1 Tax=Pseudomonas sp. EL_65y_Pfl2_R95 TaxID=3088698 RepID=UPI0030D6E439